MISKIVASAKWWSTGASRGISTDQLAAQVRSLWSLWCPVAA